MTRSLSNTPRSKKRSVSGPYYTPRRPLLTVVCAGFCNSLEPFLSLNRDVKLDTAPCAQTSKASLPPRKPISGAHAEWAPLFLECVVYRAGKSEQVTQPREIPAES